MLRRLTPLLAAAALLGLTATAHAALKPGDAAPLFTTDAAVGGKQMPLVLSDALKKGPVVLYFFPKSFTSGCTLEAHLFAEATDKFAALGATVVGISHDDIATQIKFSKEECRDKFAVAADPQSAIIKSYDAKMAMLPDVRPHLVRDHAGRQDPLRVLEPGSGRPREEHDEGRAGLARHAQAVSTMRSKRGPRAPFLHSRARRLSSAARSRTRAR